MKASLKTKTTILLFLFGVNFFVWTHTSSPFNQNVNHSKILKVAFLDIGQGDAIYIEAPNVNQIMFDGGPGKGTLGKLREVMPPLDTSIDMLVVTNPDKDHMGGFVEILKNFSVQAVVEPGTDKTTQIYKSLEGGIEKAGAQKILARQGMDIILDKKNGVKIKLLFPDRDVNSWDPNDGSIIARLEYGDQSIMLQGDASALTENILLKENIARQATILKLGHHGSRTSSSLAYLQAVQPQYAIISAGLHNSYGHPHKEVTDRLTSLKIPYIGTYQKGTIELLMDGKELTLK